MGEQPPAAKTDVTCCGSGSHEWRNRPCHTTDNDVLWGAWLEQRGVKEHVTAEAEQRQTGSEAINAAHKQHGGRQCASDGSDKGRGRRKPTGRKSATAGSGHPTVENLFPKAIENSGGGGCQRSTPKGA